MNNEKYIELAHVTCSDQFHPEKIGFNVLKGDIERCIERLNFLDHDKKALFYGTGDFNVKPENGVSFLASKFDLNLLHGIIGVATEAGELLEALYEAAFKGQLLDVINIKEEVGDVFWYLALIAKSCGFTFEEAQTINIEKLQKRFGEKFSAHAANNRNLNAEREVLEQKQHEWVDASEVLPNNGIRKLSISFTIDVDNDKKEHDLIGLFTELLSDAKESIEEKSGIEAVSLKWREIKPNLDVAKDQPTMQEVDKFIKDKNSNLV